MGDARAILGSLFEKCLQDYTKTSESTTYLPYFLNDSFLQVFNRNELCGYHGSSLELCSFRNSFSSKCDSKLCFKHRKYFTVKLYPPNFKESDSQ